MKLDGIDFSSIHTMVDTFTRRAGDNTALSELRGDQWRSVSHSALRVRSERFSRFLKARGIGPGHRIALLSESRIEWPEISFAVFMTNATLVPIDAKLAAPEIARIISHSEPTLLIVSKGLTSIWREAQERTGNLYPELLLDDESGVDLSERVRDVPGVQIEETTPNRPALIVYTSGTSGDPKGVLVPVRALLHEIETLAILFSSREKPIALSMLPMNHLFEFTGMMATLALGGEITIAKELEKTHLRKCFVERKVTQVSTVPMFLKTLKNGIEAQVNASTVLKRMVFNIFMILSRLPIGQSARRKLFSSILSSFGGRLKVIISGGAPLSPRIDRFFTRIGISVYEGYGLSETGPVIATNAPHFKRARSVGRPIPGVEVKIEAESGEILTRGPHLMSGYYLNEGLTSETIDREGWFHTGDVGMLKSDGSLWITGRTKKMIVLDGGKKVHSEDVEAVLAESAMIKDVCVLSSRSIGKPGPETVVAVVVPTAEVIESSGQKWDLLTEKIESEVRALCRTSLAPFKWPTRVYVLRRDLPKTTTMKVKAEHVARLVREEK